MGASTILQSVHVRGSLHITLACTFTGANEDGGKRRRGQDGYGVNISGTRFGTKSWNLFWSPNGSRTNITAWNLDRSARNFSARLFHFQKNTKSDIFRARTRKKQKKRPCEERTTTDPVVGRNPIHGSNSYLIPIQLKSYTHRAEIPPTGGTWSNTILVNSLPLETYQPSPGVTPPKPTHYNSNKLKNNK